MKLNNSFLSARPSPLIGSMKTELFLSPFLRADPGREMASEFEWGPYPYKIYHKIAFGFWIGPHYPGPGRYDIIYPESGSPWTRGDSHLYDKNGHMILLSVLGP